MRQGTNPRGSTLIESMIVFVVLAFGVAAGANVVSQSVRQNRRALARSQAEMLALWQLEGIEAMRCPVVAGQQPCQNIRDLDDATTNPPRDVFWSSNGPVQAVAGAASGVDSTRVRYHVMVDVDGNGTTSGGMPLREGGEMGDPPIPADSNALNVRVTVSWDEDEDPLDARRNGPLPRQAAVMQTRMAP